LESACHFVIVLTTKIPSNEKEQRAESAMKRRATKSNFTLSCREDKEERELPKKSLAQLHFFRQSGLVGYRVFARFSYSSVYPSPAFAGFSVL
jgi:hypothetical protein